MPAAKEDSQALLDKVEMWNRWADRWETLNIPSVDPSLN